MKLRNWNISHSGNALRFFHGDPGKQDWTQKFVVEDNGRLWSENLNYLDNTFVKPADTISIRRKNDNQILDCGGDSNNCYTLVGDLNDNRKFTINKH
jgi:hypothetical protein